MCISSVRQIPSDKLTYIVRSQILKKPFIRWFILSWINSGICARTQKNLFWDRKWIWCLILKSIFSIYSIRQMNLWLCKSCSITQELENRSDLYIPSLSSINYHTKVRSKCVYQFLINLTLLISIRQIFDLLYIATLLCMLLFNYRVLCGKKTFASFCQ